MGSCFIEDNHTNSHIFPKKMSLPWKIRFKDSLLDSVSTVEGRDASTQSKRYGLNRMMFLLVSLYGMITISRFMWGFPPFYHMLVEEDAFVWLCKGVAHPVFIDGVEQSYKCLEQNDAINQIYNNINVSVLMSSVFAGLLNSFLGAKLTSLLGSSLMFVGMLLLAFSNEMFRYHNIGAVLLGLGMDPIIFTSLNAVLLYPGKGLLITSILSSGTSAGMLIPVLMQHMFDKYDISFSTLMIIYSVLCPGLCFVLFLFFYPPMRFYKQEELDAAVKILLDSKPTEMGDSDINVTETEGNLEEGITLQISPPQKPSKSLWDKILIKLGIPVREVKILVRSVLSPHFLLMSSTFVIVVMVSIYSMSATSQILTESQRYLLGILIPLSFIPSIVISPFLDKTGCMFTLWYEQIFTTLFLGMLFINTTVSKYIAIVAFALFFTYFNAQIWLFCVETFDPSIHTIIIGIANFLGGLAALATPTIYRLITERNNSELQSALPLFLGLSLVQGILVSILHLIKLKRSKVI